VQSPTLNELPPPPPGKTGWPWTEEAETLPDTMPDGSNWPKISIVTPSYNQGQFIEETIRSVLLQGYPNIEYIIIDGGSKDSTVEVIKKYEPFIAYWVSEKDNGQANALNKGFARATGEIFYWINSDDFPAKNTFGVVANFFARNPEYDVAYGDCFYIDGNYELLKVSKPRPFSKGDLIIGNIFDQPTTFFKAEVWGKFGQTREDLRFIMDYELWLRWALKDIRFAYCPQITVYFRLHGDSKSTNLQRVNQNENFALLVQLGNSGQVSADLVPKIKMGLKQLCLQSYWLRDSRQFWSLLVKYIKYTKAFPDFSLLLRGLLVLSGKGTMERMSQLKYKFQKAKAR
jgi:glycosyltransferase involved in cell wall biosynthesis